ncbi:MAG: DUF1933 domain-containing protein [Rickettsiales bacterium]|nr:DUF1933 domain-containing protein [Rickettsiales bacterium]
MFSFVLTLKSKMDILEKNFSNTQDLNYYLAYNNTDFAVAILSRNTIEPHNIFYEYDKGSFVALIGSIFNKIEIISIVQSLDPHSITYSNSQLFYTLFQHLGTNAISLIDGRFAILFIKNNTIKLYSNSNATYPLYYYNEEDNFWISNEAKFLSKLKTIDSSLVHFNSFNPKAMQPNYFTIFQRIKRIPLLHSLECKISDHKFITIKYASYYKKQESSIEILQSNKVLSFIDYALHNTIRNLLNNLYNTKNVGIALSGGIDSSIVAAYIKECNPQLKIHCFTTGTTETNEFYDAKLCAEFLGAEHYEVIINEKIFIDGVMNLVYYNEMFDAFAIEAYASLDTVYAECTKYSNILFTGINADNIFSSSYELGISAGNIQQPFFNLSRFHWNGAFASYNATMRSIIEYSPYASTKLISLVKLLAARIKMQNCTDKYLLKILAEGKKFLPMHNIFREKVRYDKGSAADVIFAEFLNINTDKYHKKHLYIYRLFQLLFEQKVNFRDVDPYEIRNKLSNY